MTGEVPPEPRNSFLGDIDGAATEELALHCIGGFAVSLYYGLSRPTGDLDVVARPATNRAQGQLDLTIDVHRAQILLRHQSAKLLTVSGAARSVSFTPQSRPAPRKARRLVSAPTPDAVYAL
jgi:hypothetical protein